jgi:hypothetical protein
MILLLLLFYNFKINLIVEKKESDYEEYDEEVKVSSN